MVILTSFPPPTEGVRILEPNTVAHVGRRDLGKGTLYIAESRVSWVSNASEGFSLEYPAISLHAVSRDHRAYPEECLYMMIDANLDEGREEQESESTEEQHDYEDITEIRFIPDNKTMLEALFHAMSECQALHPDPNDSISEEDDDDENNGFEDASDVAIDSDFLGRNGDGRGDSEFEPMDDSQFEDAEPEH